MNTLKLKYLIERIADEQSNSVHQETEWSNEEKKVALEAIGRYNEYGGQLRREYNLMEIAHTLAKITESAEKFTMTETEDWFDKRTVSENMKQLRKVSDEFNKLAKDAHVMQQRMESLYEDAGHLLGRYFEINDLNEGLAPAISKIKKAE